MKRIIIPFLLMIFLNFISEYSFAQTGKKDHVIDL
jgi:hypothetical protein